MPKLKTRKVISKRVKRAKHKLITRTCGQDHFNARETGKVGRNKRRNRIVHKSIQRNVERALGI